MSGNEDQSNSKRKSLPFSSLKTQALINNTERKKSVNLGDAETITRAAVRSASVGNSGGPTLNSILKTSSSVRKSLTEEEQTSINVERRKSIDKDAITFQVQANDFMNKSLYQSIIYEGGSAAVDATPGRRFSKGDVDSKKSSRDSISKKSQDSRMTGHKPERDESKRGSSDDSKSTPARKKSSVDEVSVKIKNIDKLPEKQNYVQRLSAAIQNAFEKNKKPELMIIDRIKLKTEPELLSVRKRANSELSHRTSLSSAYSMYRSTTNTWTGEFDDTMQAQYSSYYKDTFLRNWALVVKFNIIVVVIYIIQYLMELDGRGLSSSSSFWIIVGVLGLTSIVELILLFLDLPMDLQYRCFLWYASIFGLALGALEPVSLQSFPPGHVYVYLTVLYGTVSPNVIAINLLGMTSAVSHIAVSWLMYYLNANYYSYCSLDNNGHCYNVTMYTSVVLACMMSMGLVKSYSNYINTRKQFYNLYCLWEENHSLKKAGERAEAISLSIIPKGILEYYRVNEKMDLKALLSNPMYSYKNVSILFGDIVKFTVLSTLVSAELLVQLLNNIFLDFDNIIETYGLEKIKTLGDCYMVCAGVPEPVEYHALRTVAVGLKMIHSVLRRANIGNFKLQLRVGVHSGDVFAGILGEERIIFDVWSDDVSIASLMEQTGKPSKVHITNETKLLLGRLCNYEEGPTVKYQENEIGSQFIEKISDEGNTVIKGIILKDPATTDSSSTLLSSTHEMMPPVEKQKKRRFSLANTMKKAEKKEIMYRSMVFGDAQLQRDTVKSETEFCSAVIKIRKQMNDDMNTFTLAFLQRTEERDYEVRISKKYNRRLFAKIAFSVIIQLLTLMRVLSENIPNMLNAVIIILVIDMLMLIYITLKIWRDELYNRRRASEIQNKNIIFKKTAMEIALTKLFKNKLGHSSVFPVVLMVSFLIEIIIEAFYDPSKNSLNQVFLFLFFGHLFTRTPWLYVSLYSIVLPITVLIIRKSWVTFLPSDRAFLFASIVYLIIVVISIITFSRKTEATSRKNYLLKVNLGNRKSDVDDIRINAEKILYKLLPKHVVDRLKHNPDREISDNIESGGILFCSITDFNGNSQQSIGILNDIFGRFDELLADYDVEKIKTIGTSATYMAACGLTDFKPQRRRSRYVAAEEINQMFQLQEEVPSQELKSEPIAEQEEPEQSEEDVITRYEVKYYDIDKKQKYKQLLSYALELKNSIALLNELYKTQYEITVGIHVGPLVAGVIGKTKFSYDVWGDTVNVASRMNSHAKKGQIQVSERVYKLLVDDFDFEAAGPRHIKGKGQMLTFILVGKKEETNIEQFPAV